MLTNRVGSKKIEERLGRSGASSRDPDEPRSDEASSNGNTLFACSVVVLFIAGASMGLAYSKGSAGIKQAVWESIVGPPPPPAYRSRVAETCDKGWKDNRFNRDQMHCYMTRDVARLCDPRERHALVDKLLAYQAAMDRVDGRMNFAALQIIANPGATMALGMADARSHDPNLSEAERAARFDKTMEISSAIMSPVDAIQKDNVNTATKEVLVADVKSLVERGFLASADFASSTQPKIVKEGLAAARYADSLYCR